MRLGASEIASFRVGTNAVARLYLGTALVSGSPPAGGPITFIAPPYAGFRAVQISASDALIDVQNDNDQSLYAWKTAYHGSGVTGANGKSPTVRLRRTPSNHETLMIDPEIWNFCWGPTVDGPWSAFPTKTVETNYIDFTGATFATDQVHFRTMPTPSPGLVQQWVTDWIANPLTSPTESAIDGYRIGTLSERTRNGTTIPAIDVRAFKVGTGARKMVITGVIHPDESPAYYAMQAAINWLLSPAGEVMRGRFTVYVYPNMNPQGHWAGATRLDLETGLDANREWLTSGSQIRTIHRTARAADLVGGIVCHYDFHSNPTQKQTAHGRSVWFTNLSNATLNSEFMSGFPSPTPTTLVSSANGQNSHQTGTEHAHPTLPFFGVIFEHQHNIVAGPAEWALLSEQIMTRVNALWPVHWTDAAPASAPVITGVVPANTTADVTFTYAGFDAGAFEYRIGAGAWTATGRTTPGTFTVPSLTGGTTYTVQVRATNAAGDGPASDPPFEFTTTGGTTSLIRFDAGSGGLPASMSTPWATTSGLTQDPGGYLIVQRSNGARTALVVTDVSFANGQVAFEFRIPTLAGTSLVTIVAPLMRAAGAAATETGVYVRATRNSGGARVFRGVQLLNGTATTFGSDFSTWEYDTWYRCRMEVIGGTQRFKVWLATDPEPAGWTVENTDVVTATAAGNPGIFITSPSTPAHIRWLSWSDGGTAPLG